MMTELNAEDLDFLRESIRIAERARERGVHPFGSLVVSAAGEVVSTAENNSLPPHGDPTQHAEMQAVAGAWRAVGAEGMVGSTLFTSAEPCAMCAGAAYWTGIDRVVYALSERSLLELTGDHPENPTFSLPCREVFARGQREIQVVGPLLEDEAAVAHLGFWTAS
ncbi:tRNA(Arg) A34 adenosine deaminase TadA [Microbacterium halimionae]|uniref:tRNA(Arg) A34 adenosine deaminase TadA n=1 Tax=Microbacterium halimionae TaxID=1526413 RepID=A0A7W3JQN9_9MICO|nr:nucleoside deaminase [Microbacterium halimionae]MBA8817143.1 tRNA(Arg) A34 adenosine deaminase TadA [Microbacterium halimionae]NII94593.1 tRNA(Arg) A34 adenosine deaminase TadA [Microbacterium halimionae]